MTNSNLTEKRLAEISEDGFLEYGDAKKMAAELQQYRKAEGVPVAMRWRFLSDGINGMGEWNYRDQDHIDPLNAHAMSRQKEMLYTAPPATVVPSEIRNRLKAEGLGELLNDARDYAPLTAEQWETLANNWHQTFVGLSGEDDTGMLQAGNSPVIPDGYLLVPVKETLEMAVAGDRVYELCVERDEYPTDAARRIWAAMVAAAPLQGDTACTK